MDLNRPPLSPGFFALCQQQRTVSHHQTQQGHSSGPDECPTSLEAIYNLRSNQLWGNPWPCSPAGAHKLPETRNLLSDHTALFSQPLCLVFPTDDTKRKLQVDGVILVSIVSDHQTMNKSRFVFFNCRLRFLFGGHKSPLEWSTSQCSTDAQTPLFLRRCRNLRAEG